MVTPVVQGMGTNGLAGDSDGCGICSGTFWSILKGVMYVIIYHSSSVLQIMTSYFQVSRRDSN